MDMLEERVASMRALLIEHRDTGDHLKLMPIGSEVPYEGSVDSVGTATVTLRTPLSVDDDGFATLGERDAEPLYAVVRVAIDRVEAIVVMPATAKADTEGI